MKRKPSKNISQKLDKNRVFYKLHDNATGIIWCNKILIGDKFVDYLELFKEGVIFGKIYFI